MSSLEVEPYQALSKIYDQVMLHVDYLEWVNFALTIMSDHGLPHPSDADSVSLLECGCGTGSMSLILAACGFRVIGFDKSPQMIEVAWNKALSLDNSPEFFVSEFTLLDYSAIFRGAVCLYDSLNYLLDLKSVQSFLRNVHAALVPDGLFLFDICTELNSLKYFDNHSETGQGLGYTYHRKMNYDAAEKIQENIFTIQFKEHSSKGIVECHRQKIYSESEIIDAVEKSGFKIIEVVDGQSRNPSHSQSTRIHFLVRKN